MLDQQTLEPVVEPAANQQRGRRNTPLQQWLRIDPGKQPRVYADVYAGADFASLSYWLGILFSAGIATLGLVQDSPAVIIGAMLISPLMGPIMAAGMGLAVGDLYLALKAILNLVASVSVAVAFSAFIVWLLPFHSATAEILARTNPTLLDLGIALCSGLAGSVVVGRAGNDGPTALPGVAIAVALMPPLCTVGFGFGSGMDLHIIGGAALLFLTNLVAIISSAFAVFLLVGMNACELEATTQSARNEEFIARRLAHLGNGRFLTQSGRLRWRILVIVLLLAAIAFPLKSAFVQLTQEAIARSVVQQVIRDLLPHDSLVSQQLEVGRKSISIRLFSTQGVPAAKQREAEEMIARRSGRATQLEVTSVASQADVQEMMSRFAAIPVAAPVQTPPPPQSIDDIRKQLLQRITPALTRTWPAAAPLQSFDVALQDDGITLQVEYAAPRDLTPIAIQLIEQQVAAELAIPDLRLSAHRAVPQRGATKRRSASAGAPAADDRRRESRSQ